MPPDSLLRAVKPSWHVHVPSTVTVCGCPVVAGGLDGELARLQDQGTEDMAPLAVSPARAGSLVPSWYGPPMRARPAVAARGGPLTDP